MAAILIEPPAGEPLTLNEAKNYLRVGHDADDALIQSMIASARVQVEARTRRALAEWLSLRDQARACRTY